MASSQAKITSFYRNSKQSSTTLAAKRRKAVLGDSGILPTVDEIKPLPVLTQKCDEDVKTSTGSAKSSVELSSEGSLKMVIRVPKTVKSEAKQLKVRKTKRPAQTKAEVEAHEDEKPPVLVVVPYVEEITSVEDSHGCSPEVKEVCTPKHFSDNSTSTRKRKMEASCQDNEPKAATPVKLEDGKEENRTPTKVRKRLEMNADKPSVGSPVKNIPFLCLGTLSPAKSHASPFKSPKPVTPRLALVNAVEKSCLSRDSSIKSSAVKSLASLLDNVSTNNVANKVCLGNAANRLLDLIVSPFLAADCRRSEIATWEEQELGRTAGQTEESQQLFGSSEGILQQQQQANPAAEVLLAGIQRPSSRQVSRHCSRILLVG